MNEQYLPNELPITHAYGCWSWGPRHFLCAVREIHRLENELEALRAQFAQQTETGVNHGQSSI